MYKMLTGTKRVVFRVCEIFMGVIIMVTLTSTGVMEWLVFFNINSESSLVDTRSEIITWIKENTTPEDVFLTPMWSLNRFTLAGRPLFYGWPYYAWSAGHDTDKRGAEYTDLLAGCGGNKERFVEICKKYHMKYVIDEPEMFSIQNEGGYYNQQFIQNNFELIAVFKDEDTRIYQVY